MTSSSLQQRTGLLGGQLNTGLENKMYFFPGWFPDGVWPPRLQLDCAFKTFMSIDQAFLIFIVKKIDFDLFVKKKMTKKIKECHCLWQFHSWVAWESLLTYLKHHGTQALLFFLLFFSKQLKRRQVATHAHTQWNRDRPLCCLYVATPHLIVPLDNLSMSNMKCFFFLLYIF